VQLSPAEFTTKSKAKAAAPAVAQTAEWQTSATVTKKKTDKIKA